MPRSKPDLIRSVCFAWEPRKPRRSYGLHAQQRPASDIQRRWPNSAKPLRRSSCVAIFILKRCDAQSTKDSTSSSNGTVQPTSSFSPSAVSSQAIGAKTTSSVRSVCTCGYYRLPSLKRHGVDGPFDAREYVARAGCTSAMSCGRTGSWVGRRSASAAQRVFARNMGADAIRSAV